MATVRDYVTEALALRAKHQLKVRQPLNSMTIPHSGQFVDFVDILREEINVKQVHVGGELSIDTVITPDLHREGLMREIIRHVQTARKNAKLSVDDRIELSLTTTDHELNKAISEHIDTIHSETLASKTDMTSRAHQEDVSINNAMLTISLQKQRQH
jgi:isoleucyl-tRNA synthetase